MWYNGSMITSDWITLGAAILTGGGTLFLGIMAWKSIRQTRSIQKTDKRERLLNEIIEWATDVRKYASIPHIIDPNSYSRMMSADRFFTLKYNGKKFLIAVKKQAIGDDLQSLLSNAIEFLEKNWRDLATNPLRREEIVRDLDKIGETIVEKAGDLLLSNS